jgi:hypothetical protein
LKPSSRLDGLPNPHPVTTPSTTLLNGHGNAISR